MSYKTRHIDVDNIIRNDLTDEMLWALFSSRYIIVQKSFTANRSVPSGFFILSLVNITNDALFEMYTIFCLPSTE